MVVTRGDEEMQIGRTARSGGMTTVWNCAAALAGMTLVAAPAMAQPALGVMSPDHRIPLDVTAAGDLRYRVERDGAPLADSPMGLSTSQGSFGGDGVTVASSEAVSVNDSYVPLAGKASRVADRYNRLTLGPMNYTPAVSMPSRPPTWTDGAGINDLKIETGSVAGGGRLTLELAASGGAVAIVAPAGDARQGGRP